MPQGFLGRQSPWGADALTVSPYLGDDSLQPFVDVAVRGEAGVFVLVKTSNPGGRMLQDLVADGRPIYRHVAPARRSGWPRPRRGACGYGAVGAVVGATYPAQLAELRAADAAHLVSRARLRQPRRHGRRRGRGLRSARARGDRQQFPRHHLRPSPAPYCRAFRRRRWQEAVEAATRDMIEQLRADTPAGSLQ